MKLDFKRPIVITAFIITLGLSIFSPLQAHAQITISQPLADKGSSFLQLPFFSDDSGTDSVVQAQVQLTRNQNKPMAALSITNAGGTTYWANLHITNNSNNPVWQVELPSAENNQTTMIKSLDLYDIRTPDKPVQSWPNGLLKPTLQLVIQPGETIDRFVLIKTWPGIKGNITPILKTANASNIQAVLLNRKLGMLWLIIGAVIGAGLVQLILTRQAVQGFLALNGLVVGVAIYLTFRNNQFPQLSGIHPFLLSITVNSALGILASIVLIVAGYRQKNKSYIALLPLILNIVAIAGSIFFLDDLISQLPLQSLPYYLLCITGCLLMLTTIILGVGDLLLFFYAPAWLMLMVSPLLSDELPFALPVAYVFFLAVAGVASVFSYWHSMDKETESLQRRLRTELRTTKEKYKEESNKWNKKMESERVLLTELKQREQQRAKELEIAKKEADAANKAKSDFLAIISHEIRTPMNGILGVLQIIEKTPLSEKQSEYIEIIKNSGDTMLTLLNDILDYSKIENGAIDLEFIDFSLRKLANSVSMLMQGRAEASGLNVIVDIAEGIPDTYNSDVGRIRQILLNLVSNAIKFTERGSVTIKISKQSNDPFTLLFEVIDTGMGISEEGQSKLFQAYAQADSSITRRFGGTGLGLNICRMLVNAMQGQIGVRSEIGKGSTFWFDLPLKVANTALAETTKEAVPEYKPAKQIYALVIDDNEVNLKIINSFLEMDGHEAVTATTAMRGLQLIEQDRFDVVFVDMIMPEMDGKAFVAKLRQNPNAIRANLPVIALTGLTAKEDIDDMQAIGMRDILIKPVSQTILRQSIDRLVLNPDFAGDIKLPDIMARLDDLSDNEKAKLRDALNSPDTAPSFVTDKPALNIEMMKELKSSLPASTLKELFDDLIEKSKELTDEIEKDLTSENFENLGRNGHNIQGMAGNFGLTLLADHSRDIERAVRDGDNEKAAALAKDSRQILDYSLHALDEWLKS